MTLTNISLGRHWEVFVKDQVASGKYATEAEVIHDALRQMEKRQSQREALRERLSEGLEQAKRGEFSDVTIADINRQLDESE